MPNHVEVSTLELPEGKIVYYAYPSIARIYKEQPPHNIFWPHGYAMFLRGLKNHIEAELKRFEPNTAAERDRLTTAMAFHCKMTVNIGYIRKYKVVCDDTNNDEPRVNAGILNLSIWFKRHWWSVRWQRLVAVRLTTKV